MNYSFIPKNKRCGKLYHICYEVVKKLILDIFYFWKGHNLILYQLVPIEEVEKNYSHET